MYRLSSGGGGKMGSVKNSSGVDEDLEEKHRCYFI
jgi:hypothetical protein